jgi:hypothetical protein
MLAGDPMEQTGGAASRGPSEEPLEGEAPPHRELRPATAALAIGALTLLVFLPALRCGFVHLDDPQTVPRYGVVLRGLSWDGVRLAFGSNFFGHWAPLTVLSLMLDWQLWGRVAYGHHLTSLLLHAGAAMLAFFLLQRATGATARAAAVALLFALHPLRVEPVLWITGRKDLIAGGFSLLSLLLYVRWREAPSIGRWLAVTAAFAAALLGKATAMVVPALMLVLDLWPLERLGRATPLLVAARRLRPLVLEKLPWMAMSAAASATALWSARASAAMAELDSVSPSERLATAAVGYAHYLRTTFWPTGLAAFYPLPRGGWPASQVAFSAALFLIVTIVALAVVRRFPWVTAGWLWWVACLAPVSGLLQAGEQAAADRYTYLASIGLGMAVVWSVAELASRSAAARRTAAALAVVALAGCIPATRAQIAIWRDSESVFRRMVAVTADNHFGHLNLANVLAETGRRAAAIGEYRAAIALRPDVALAWTGLGAALRAQGDRAGARDALAQALRLEPRLSSAHLQLAAVYEEEGALGPAAGHLARAISLEPHHAQAWQGFVAVLARPGAARQALPYVAAVARSEPGSRELRDLLRLVEARAASEGTGGPAPQ